MNKPTFQFLIPTVYTFIGTFFNGSEPRQSSHEVTEVDPLLITETLNIHYFLYCFLRYDKKAKLR